MDSNGDKEGPVAETELKVTICDMREGDHDQEAIVADKPTSEEEHETSVKLAGVKTLIRMDSDADKEGSLAELEHKMILSGMGDVDQGPQEDDKATPDENPGAADVNQLVKSRQEALKLKQMARRAAWQEQVKAELDKRAEAKLKMETTPRNQITSRKDKQIFSKISVQARKTFRRERTQFLFHDVFPILSQNQPQNPAWSFPLKEMLTCRLGSKQWKDVIDNSLSATSSHYHEMFSGVDQNRLQYRHSCIQFFSLDQLKGFNRKCEQEYRGSNPLPFRQLYIGHVLLLCPGYGKLGMAYWSEMEKLLERWGKEIWTALYVFEVGSIEMMYEFLIKYLSLMPNLRKLAIVERDRSNNLEADMLRSLGKDVFGPLKLRIERRPLPELPHLRSVNFGEFSNPPLIDAVLAKYGDTLESLKIEAPGFDKYAGEYVDLGQFPAGRELHFSSYYCVYKNSSLITNWNFQFPSLNKLRLDYLLVKKDAQVHNIFKTVNSCGSTIRRLRLRIHFDVPYPKRETDWKNLLPTGIKLELPHLEWLHLIVEGSKILDVDFLLPLASLKEMTFQYLMMGSEASPTDGAGVIQFAGYRDRFYDSNIWTLLPELRLVTLNGIDGPLKKYFGKTEAGVASLEYPNLTTTVYTREGYRQRPGRNPIQMLTE